MEDQMLTVDLFMANIEMAKAYMAFPCVETHAYWICCAVAEKAHQNLS